MHLLIWTAAGQRYAIESGALVEVVPVVEARPLPRTPPWIRGLIDFRGILVPLLDARCLLGRGETELRRACRIVIALTDDGIIGLLVETVEGVERCDPEPAHPGLAVAETPYLGPLVRTAGGSAQLVEPRDLLRDEHREILFSRATGAAP